MPGTPSDPPHEPAPGASAGAALQRGPSLRCPILKPCEFTVKALSGRRTTTPVKVPGACTREDGLDGALDRESGGTSRRNGQDRATFP